MVLPLFPEATDDLPGPQPLPDLHAHRAGLHMEIRGVSAGRDALHHAVAAEVPWRTDGAVLVGAGERGDLRAVVDRGHDGPVRDRMNRRAVAEPVSELAAIARIEGAAGFTDPVDREHLGRAQRSGRGQQEGSVL